MSDQIVHRIFDWPTFKVQDGQSPQTWPSNQYGRRHLHVPPCATATTLHYGVRVAPSPLGDCIAIIFARTALAPSPLGWSFLPQTSSRDVANGGRAAHHKPPAIAAAASPSVILNVHMCLYLWGHTYKYRLKYLHVFLASYIHI